MASSANTNTDSSPTRSAAQDISQQLNRSQGEEIPSATPVEMSSLAARANPTKAETTSPPPAPSINPMDQKERPQSSSKAVSPPAGPVRTDTVTALTQATNPPPPPEPSLDTSSALPATRTFSTAIGPSSDSPIVPSKDGADSTGPTLLITLLLTSGARHPFRLDGKYLTKRNADVAGNDPFNLSVYKLKELILREWREEWEAKPSSPSAIRLISFGKLLDDKTALKDSRFNHDAPNVVHMTVKPQDFVEEEDTKGGKGALSSRGDTERRSPGCRCVVM